MIAELKRKPIEGAECADDENDFLKIRASAEIAAFTKRQMADAIEAGQHLENKDG